jgi:hypothetical protein
MLRRLSEVFFAGAKHAPIAAARFRVSSRWNRKLPRRDPAI